MASERDGPVRSRKSWVSAGIRCLSSTVPVSEVTNGPWVKFRRFLDIIGVSEVPPIASLSHVKAKYMGSRPPKYIGVDALASPIKRLLIHVYLCQPNDLLWFLFPHPVLRTCILHLEHINFSPCNAYKPTAALTTAAQRAIIAVDAGRGKDCPGIETEVPCGLNLPIPILLV
jgi:hypothetical protein